MILFYSAPSGNYERLRGDADAACGLPSRGQETCLTPADESPRDAEGNVLFALDLMLPDSPAIAGIASQYVSRGEATTMTEGEYFSAIIDGAGG